MNTKSEEGDLAAASEPRTCVSLGRLSYDDELGVITWNGRPTIDGLEDSQDVLAALSTARQWEAVAHAAIDALESMRAIDRVGRLLADVGQDERGAGA